MIFHIKYSESQSIFIIKTNGVMTGDGFVVMAGGILRHPRWATGKNVLFDHRELNFLSVASEDLEKIRSFHKSHNDKIGPGKSAIVVSPGQAAQWEKLWARGQKIQTANTVKVFEDYKAAIEWIKNSP